MGRLWQIAFNGPPVSHTSPTLTLGSAIYMISFGQWYFSKFVTGRDFMSSYPLRLASWNLAAMYRNPASHVERAEPKCFS